MFVIGLFISSLSFKDGETHLLNLTKNLVKTKHPTTSGSIITQHWEICSALPIHWSNSG